MKLKINKVYFSVEVVINQFGCFSTGILADITSSVKNIFLKIFNFTLWIKCVLFFKYQIMKNCFRSNFRLAVRNTYV